MGFARGGGRGRRVGVRTDIAGSAVPGKCQIGEDWHCAQGSDNEARKTPTKPRELPI